MVEKLNTAKIPQIVDIKITRALMHYRILSLLTILFIGFASAANAKDTLKIGLSQYPVNLNPLFTTHLGASYVLGFVKSPLVLYNHDWQAECRLCTELPTLENGRIKEVTREDDTKALDITYTLHENAVWADGTPITSEDVLFSWKVGNNPDTGISYAELYQNRIKDVTIIDDKNFVLHMDKVTCDAASVADFHIMPKHLEEAVYNKDPAKYRETSLYTTDPTNKGLYDGPYIIKDIEVGAKITLIKNPKWWGKEPAFEEIVLNTIENTTSLTANLLAGEIDMISGELGLPIDQALSLEKKISKRAPNKYEILYEQGLVYEHIDLNLDNPIFQDTKTRQAMLHGINRQVISDQLFGGKQTLANTNIHPLDAHFINDTQSYDYNPEQAEALLKDAGWKKGDDGILVNAEDKKLSFEFLTTAGNQSRELVQQAIQSDWKKLGIEARIQNQTPRVLFGETARKRATDGAVMYAWLSPPANVPRSTLYSTQIPSEENSYAGQNYVGYKNPKLDKIIDDLEVMCAIDDQKKLWAELQQIYADDLPALPLYYRANAYFTPKWLKGIKPTGHQYPSTLWVTEWETQN